MYARWFHLLTLLFLLFFFSVFVSTRLDRGHESGGDYVLIKRINFNYMCIRYVLVTTNLIMWSSISIFYDFFVDSLFLCLATCRLCQWTIKWSKMIWFHFLLHSRHHTLNNIYTGFQLMLFWVGNLTLSEWLIA